MYTDFLKEPEMFADKNCYESNFNVPNGIKNVPMHAHVRCFECVKVNCYHMNRIFHSKMFLPVCTQCQECQGFDCFYWAKRNGHPCVWNSMEFYCIVWLSKAQHYTFQISQIFDNLSTIYVQVRHNSTNIYNTQ